MKLEEQTPFHIHKYELPDGTKQQIKLYTMEQVKKCCLDKQRVKEFSDAAEMLWVVLANVSEGDWTKQTKEWQEAAAKWRDNYFKKLKELGLED